MSERLGRRLEAEHVVALVEKLGAQGLLAGTESLAPPRQNPLLALRWKVLVTDPKLTRRLTAPFMWLFSPLVIVPVVLAFLGVFWFVLFHKGIASATAQAFHSPGLLLLVFGLAVVSAAFHEIGHASACRYGGATPGGMGMGMYLVWPAFYTDVTDAYRLPERARLRVDLGGMYFNAIIAVVTLGRMAARARRRAAAARRPAGAGDGQEALAGDPLRRVPHPLRRDRRPGPLLAPAAHRAPAAALAPRAVGAERQGPAAGHHVGAGDRAGDARRCCSARSCCCPSWPPAPTTAAATSSRRCPTRCPTARSSSVLASVLRLIALGLPLLGSVLVSPEAGQDDRRQGAHLERRAARRRRTVAVVAALAAMARDRLRLVAVRPVPAGPRHRLRHRRRLGQPRLGARPRGAPERVPPAGVTAQPVHLAPGRHLAISMIPVGGASRRHPALFVIEGRHGQPAVAILSATGKVPDGTPVMPAPPVDRAATATRRRVRGGAHTHGAPLTTPQLDDTATVGHGDATTPAGDRPDRTDRRRGRRPRSRSRCRPPPGPARYPGDGGQPDRRRRQVRRRLLAGHGQRRRARRTRPTAPTRSPTAQLHDRRGLLPGRADRRGEQADRADQRRRLAQLQLPGVRHDRDRRPDRGHPELDSRARR